MKEKILLKAIKTVLTFKPTHRKLKLTLQNLPILRQKVIQLFDAAKCAAINEIWNFKFFVANNECTH